MLRALIWIAREIARWGILLDLFCHRLVARALPPQHVLLGRCHRRGACCRQLVLDPPGPLKRSFLAMRLFAAYHRVLHRFHVVGRTEKGALVLSCGHLTAAGHCGIYRHRPRLCRDYPVLPFFGPPRLLPGCGYRTARREVARMRRRRGLGILGEHVAVHHPDPGRSPGDHAIEEASDFHLVASPPGGPAAPGARR